MAADTNTTVLVGRLTRDPELRHTAGGTPVCGLRLAFSTRARDADGGWADKSNYIDVVVWGRQGETCADHLAKGRRVGVTGRLEWREWDTQDGGKRQTIEVVADHVQYLDPRDDREARDGNPGPAAPATSTPRDDSDIPFKASAA